MVEVAPGVRQAPVQLIVVQTQLLELRQQLYFRT